MNVLSCNRLVADGDGEFFPVLSAAWPPPDFNLHIGDRIYADSVADAARDSAKRHGRPSPGHTDYLRAYREAYLTTWTNPDFSLLLRSASNILLADDHDIISNLNGEKWRPPTATASLPTPRRLCRPQRCGSMGVCGISGGLCVVVNTTDTWDSRG